MKALAAARLGAIALIVALTGTACTIAAQETVSVSTGSLEMGVEVTGALEAVDKVSIAPPSLSDVWDFKISMMTPEGSEVEPDAPVVGFDTSDLSRRLDQKTGERDTAAQQLEVERAKTRVTVRDDALAVAQAAAELRKAEAKADAPAAITSVVDLEKARLDVTLSREKVAYLDRKHAATRQRETSELARLRGQRDRADGRVQEMTAAVAKLTVVAPRAGTLIYETNWRGEKKKVGDSTWRGETIMQIASLDNMSAAGQIDEVDASKVAVGQAVSLRLDAQSDLELRGKITKISQTVRRASPENPLKVISVDITLDEGQSAKLRPSMRFRGRVETERVDDVLRVPIDAVLSTRGGPVVYRLEAGKVEVTDVELGRRDREHVEVLSGVREGDEIVAAPQAPGDRS